MSWSGALPSRELPGSRSTRFGDDLLSAPEAFLGLFSGANTGTMLVRL